MEQQEEEEERRTGFIVYRQMQVERREIKARECSERSEVCCACVRRGQA